MTENNCKNGKKKLDRLISQQSPFTAQKAGKKKKGKRNLQKKKIMQTETTKEKKTKTRYKED